MLVRALTTATVVADTVDRRCGPASAFAAVTAEAAAHVGHRTRAVKCAFVVVTSEFDRLPRDAVLACERRDRFAGRVSCARVGVVELMDVDAWAHKGSSVAHKAKDGRDAKSRLQVPWARLSFKWAPHSTCCKRSVASRSWRRVLRFCLPRRAGGSRDSKLPKLRTSVCESDSSVWGTVLALTTQPDARQGTSPTAVATTMPADRRRERPVLVLADGTPVLCLLSSTAASKI